MSAIALVCSVCHRQIGAFVPRVTTVIDGQMTIVACGFCPRPVLATGQEMTPDDMAFLKRIGVWADVPGSME
tara:strand:- start:7250 stop:7465 length:216 start_codon:yes stop_codon:yes gene_type:complete